MSSPVYSFERQHHTWDIYDADGEVGCFGFDSTDREWWVVANCDRFTSVAGLPGAFGGFFHHRLPSFDAVHAMFGVALPSLSEMVVADRGAAVSQISEAA